MSQTVIWPADLSVPEEYDVYLANDLVRPTAYNLVARIALPSVRLNELGKKHGWYSASIHDALDWCFGELQNGVRGDGPWVGHPTVEAQLSSPPEAGYRSFSVGDILKPAGSDIGFVCENHRWTPTYVRNQP
jgi:hypothetical protein